MSRRVRRLLFVGVLTLLASLAVVGGAAAGAASAPAPIPEAQLAPVEVPAVEDGEPSPGAPAAAPRRHAAVGVIVGIRPGRIAVAVKSRDKPVIVGIRPATQIRVNRHQATFEDLQTGDAVLVVGRPGPRGNVIARTVSALQTARSS